MAQLHPSRICKITSSSPNQPDCTSYITPQMPPLEIATSSSNFPNLAFLNSSTPDSALAIQDDLSTGSDESECVSEFEDMPELEIYGIGPRKKKHKAKTTKPPQPTSTNIPPQPTSTSTSSSTSPTAHVPIPVSRGAQSSVVGPESWDADYSQSEWWGEKWRLIQQHVYEWFDGNRLQADKMLQNNLICVPQTKTRG